MLEADGPEPDVRTDARLGEVLAGSAPAGYAEVLTDSAPASYAEWQHSGAATPAQPPENRQEGVLADTGVDLDPQVELLDRLRRTPGLAALVDEAVATWRAREGTSDDGTPGWRAFSDAFPTFWEFSNRPR